MSMDHFYKTKEDNMTLYTQALMTRDQDVIMRSTAAAARLKIPDPSYWVQGNMWELTSLPGWEEAYDNALRVTPVKPGANETALTDELILAGVLELKPENQTGEVENIT